MSPLLNCGALATDFRTTKYYAKRDITIPENKASSYTDAETQKKKMGPGGPGIIFFSVSSVGQVRNLIYSPGSRKSVP